MTKFLTCLDQKGLQTKKLHLTQMVEFEVEREVNVVGKEENYVYQHFLLFSQCF